MSGSTCGVVLLAAVLGSLPGTARAVFTEIRSLEVETQSGLFGTCDTGVGIGGGVEGVEPTWTVHSSYVSTLSSGYWTGFVQNLGAPSTVKTAAVCANGSGWPGFQVVEDEFQIPAGSVAGLLFARCCLSGRNCFCSTSPRTISTPNPSPGCKDTCSSIRAP